MGMMVNINSLISLLFFSTLIIQGYCQCSASNINIGTTRSGRDVQGKPEWDVSIINNCSCAQSEIKIGCKDFQSTEAVDPNLFKKIGDNCLLINGNPLAPFNAVNFSYAWDPPFILLPISTVVSPCS